MRYTLLTNPSNLSAPLSNGGVVESPILLQNPPVNTLHGATKQYVDTIVNTHTSNAIMHLTSSQNTLLDALTITSGEINHLSGVSSNIQTQLNSKLDASGGTMAGALTQVIAPSGNLHAVTKSYVDDGITAKLASLASSSIVLNTGDILSSVITTTPAGFLRANGAEVSKTTYSALFAVIGDTYSFSTYPGAGQPWRQQYDINLTGDALGAWAIYTAPPVSMEKSQVIVTKNRVYILGGWLNGTASSTVYTAPINTDGTLGAWTTGTALPVTIYASQAIVTKNRVYLLGGAASSAVYTAPINADGTLGAWTLGTSLPATIAYSQAIVTRNRVYLLGDMSSSAVYTAPINADGTLGAWTTGTTLPDTIAYPQAIVTRNRVYLLAGYVNGVISAAVYTAPINSDGTLGAWTLGTALPVTIAQSQAIVTRNRVYLLGGTVNNVPSSAVYTAPINADGTLGAWSISNPLYTDTYDSTVIVVKNNIYNIGGRTSGAAQVRANFIATISGGLNDYSPYYDGTYVATDPNNFRLPDYTVEEALTNNALKFYIKT